MQRYIPEGYTKYEPSLGDYKKDLFECYVSLEKITAIFYIGRQSKPNWHYKFSSVEKMEERIAKTIYNLMSWEDMKYERKQERKNALINVRVGQIYVSSWGYDQTNVNFYQVIEKKNSKFKIVEIAKRYCGEAPSGSMSDYVVPVRDNFIGEPIWKSGFKIRCGYLSETKDDQKHFCSWYA